MNNTYTFKVEDEDGEIIFKAGSKDIESIMMSIGKYERIENAKILSDEFEGY